MNRRLRCSTAAAFVVVAMLAFVALPPAVSHASDVDDWAAMMTIVFGPGIPLNVGSSAEVTLTALPHNSIASCYCTYDVHLLAGQTVAATCTLAPSVAAARLVAIWPNYPEVTAIPSAPASSSLCAVRFQAPEVGEYELAVLGESAPGTFTIETALVPSSTYLLSSITVPKTVRAGRFFKVSTTLQSDNVFDEFSVPVRFVVQRKSGRWWRSYLTVVADAKPDFSSRRLAVWSSIRLPKGAYRIRARFSDAAHPKATFNPWEVLRVR
jgi:hypothetical protein